MMRLNLSALAGGVLGFGIGKVLLKLSLGPAAVLGLGFALLAGRDEESTVKRRAAARGATMVGGRS